MKKNSEKINVLFVLPDFLSGGAQKQCAILYSELTKDSDLEMHFVHVWDGPNKIWLNDPNNNIVKINRKKLSDIRIVFDIIRVVKDKKIDIIVSWLHPADTYCWLVKILIRNVCWIMTERDSDYPENWRYDLRKYFAKKSDKILANSENGLKYWKKIHANSIDIDVVNNICAKTNNKEKKHGNKYYDVASIGRLEPQKNINGMVAILKEWSLMGGGNVVVGGSGSLEEYFKSEISGLSNVFFHGYINNPMNFLEKSKVFISMSFHEGTPNSMIEAIVAGCIVVASRIDEHISILGENYPFLVDIKSDVGDMVGVLRDAVIFFDRGEYEVNKIMNTAFDNIKKMDAKNVASNYKEIFFEVLKKNG